MSIYHLLLASNDKGGINFFGFNIHGHSTVLLFTEQSLVNTYLAHEPDLVVLDIPIPSKLQHFLVDPQKTFSHVLVNHDTTTQITEDQLIPIPQFLDSLPKTTI
jgi:hypothetical protein